MRTCEKNKQSMYVSLCTGEVDEVDEDGYFTGNVINQYSEPTLTRVNIYPASGKIADEVFGHYEKLDMIVVTVGTQFNTNDIFYLPENLASGKHDYYVSEMKKSLNNTYYRLTKRV